MISYGMRAASSQPRSVLVVEDEAMIGEVVARYLERAGYDTRIAQDGPQAVAMSMQRRPDLVVLDVMLPGFDGLEVLRRLRELPRPHPAVIMLTARGEEGERIAGLRRGADDYVVKPFSPNELVARVQAVLRRTGDDGDRRRELRFDGLRIDPAARTVWVGAREVALTQREFDLLAFLAAHPGQVFSRDQLMEHVWMAPDAADTSTVTVHVRRLRAKLEEGSPEGRRFLETVWGLGYRFRA